MKLLAVLSITTALALIPSLAAAQNSELEMEPIVMMGNQAEVYFNFSQAYLVQSYAVTCRGASITGLQVGIKDCCMPGDHWDAKTHLYDEKPVEAHVCASGGTTGYRTVLASSGGNPLRSIVNVRYPHGINVFPAGVYLRLTCYPSSTTITVTDLGQAPDRR
jgi:hypothetical protein